MLLNKDQSLTSSLQIVQPQQRIHFSHDSFPSDNSHLQELDYSHDQQSLSFQIEDERVDRSISRDRSRSKEKEKFKAQKEDLVLVWDSQKMKGKEGILSNQPPKRKRKQIFDKYKVPVNGEIGKQQTSMASIENDILRTFDEIFSLSTPRSQKSQQISIDSPVKNFSKKQANHNESEQVQIPITSEKEFNITKTPQNGIRILKKQSKNTYGNIQIGNHVNRNEKMDVSPITNFKMNKNTHQNHAGNVKSLMQSSSFFDTPLNHSKQKPQIHQNNEVFNLSNIQYRISYIEGKQQIEYSRDSTDFAEILGAQIFNEKPKSRVLDNVQNGSLKEIKQEETIISPQKQIKTQVENPINSPVKYHRSPNKQTLPPFHITSSSSKNSQKQFKSENQIPEQSMGESRFSDVYQRIDMSQSIASSVLIKDPKYQHQGIRTHQNIEVVRNFSRSGSLGFIGYTAQDETIIHTLASQRIIEEASQESRLPIFLRKAAKLNSVMPNFNHPSKILNIDKENESLQELITNYLDSICFLENMFEAIKIRDYKKKQIKFLFESGINLQKFLTCNFEEFNKIQGLQRLKPKENFIAKQWYDGKVCKALANYHKIISSHLGIKINLGDERGIAKYYEIRKKYWQIEKNVILIAQDMYSYLTCQGFPQHIIQMKNILNQKQIFFNQGQIRMKKMLIEKIRFLRNNGDDFCQSEVGLTVIHKLQDQIKYNSTNF